jgi:hypothetical protein
MAASTGSGPASAEQRLQLEILREDLERPADAALAARLAEISARYLGGGVPSMPVIWEPRLVEVGAASGRKFTLEGMFGHVGRRSMILLNPQLQTDSEALQRALCHEIVHAYLFARGEDSAAHGEAFQDLLRRMAEAGAFEGIVADPAERSRLRTWLDEESARLADEAAALERLHSELDDDRRTVEQGSDHAGTSANRDAYNVRADRANSRVERYNADRAAFDREVRRYELMLVYPDGRDEQ